jgi:hypothetical protein
MLKKIALLPLAIATMPLLAQEGKKDYGFLKGSFESINQLYQKDSATNAIVPQDKVGSNNFLKLDYTYKQFSAGVQFESYLPMIVGYPGNMDGSKLINKYFTYRTQKLMVTVGDFYEQFGSGLAFRAFENRQIGINNAVQGVNVHFNPIPFVQAKVIYGKQRRFFDFSDGVVRGGDLQLNWSKLPGKVTEGKSDFTTGFSYVSRYDPYTGSNPDIKPTVGAFSARASFSSGSFFIDAEHVSKSNDAHLANTFYTMKGKALLVNAGYGFKNVGVNFNFRRMENMSFRTDRNAVQAEYLVNFIPAITKQHHYNLSNIYVYNPQAIAEIGGQVDIDINFPKKSAIGGRYGANLSINYSQYNNLDITSSNVNGFKSNFLAFGEQKYFRDMSLMFKKRWSNPLTTVFEVQQVFYNKSVIEGGLHDDIDATIVTADVQYKWAKKKSVRFEAQHLSTKQDNKNWASLLAELSYAPHWTVFVTDMYNYGGAGKIHYYNAGFSYTYASHRVLLSYGRQRPGLICTGGVCRLVPAYTGLNLTLSSSF